jgi:hypothetical protein
VKNWGGQGRTPEDADNGAEQTNACGSMALKPVACRECQRLCPAWMGQRALHDGAGAQLEQVACRALMSEGWVAFGSECSASWNRGASCLRPSAPAFVHASARAFVALASAELAFVELAVALAFGRAFGSEVDPTTRVSSTQKRKKTPKRCRVQQITLTICDDKDAAMAIICGTPTGGGGACVASMIGITP